MKRILLIVLSFLFLVAAACSPDTGASNYRVSLSRTEASLEEGESVQLSAAVEQSGTEVEAEVTWKSSDPSVATVSGGNVTAVQAGSAVITATYEGAEAACVLTVTKYYQPQLRIKLNYSDVRFTQAGQTETLSAQVTLGGEASDASVSFTSVDPQIAKVSRSGLVTAVAEGETQIVARAESDGCYAESVCRVSVAPYEESVILQTDEEAYVYYRDPSRTDAVAFDGEVLSVRDEQTGTEIPYRAEEGMVTVLSGVGYGERGVVIEGANKQLIFTGIFVTYEIGSAEDLVSRMKGGTSDYLVLSQDIDMTEYLEANPWNSTDMNSGAFFNFAFAGTLDGMGHSILNLNSTAGVIERNLNTVFKELSSTGVLKNLHLQVSIGVKASFEGARRGILIGDMFGTIENCVFDVDAQFDVGWYMYGAAAFYNLSETACVRNSVFYIPNPSAIRMICATAWGADFEGCGVFENVVYIYGDPNINGALPEKRNPNLSGIYSITSGGGGSFSNVRRLNEERYNSAPAEIKNGFDLWDDVTLEDVNGAMEGFTFTDKTLRFGDTLIVDYDELTEISTAEELADAFANKPWGNYALTADIDFTQYLQEHPWDNSDTPYFFRSSSFVGTLDGRGHKITGLTRGINGDGTYDYNRHYGFFAGMGGVMKNLVMEMEVAVTCGETGFGNGAIIDSLTGTLENCVFDVTLHYDVDWGVWDSGLFTGVSDTAVIRNCAFIVNNHVSGFLFGRNNSDFTCENVAFIGKYDPKNNILKGGAESDQLPNANLHGIYLFTDLAQAVAGGGYALREDYADWGVVNGTSAWKDNDKKFSDIFTTLACNESGAWVVMQ